MANVTNETCFFKACESGNIAVAKGKLKLSSQTPGDPVVAGDPDLLQKLAEKLDLEELIKETDNQGNTALHLAVRKDHGDLVKCSVDLMKQLVELDASLCDCANKEGETPLELAVSLGFKEAVEFLITRTSNALHYIVELNQVKLVQYLKKQKVDLSKLINQPYQPATNLPDNEGDRATHPQIDGDTPLHISARNTLMHSQIIRGDTPLHIAARNKFEPMVDLLLKIHGVNKHALNDDCKTPLHIAREVIEYHESFRIIRKLGDFEPKGKPFMYCAPQISYKKHKKAGNIINKAYEDRRTEELVVAALLATMTFTAAFTVPGGFQTDTTLRNELGSPILIRFTSFKLFLMFDCIAFLLSLFACIMWEMTSELTVGDKLLFMTINSAVVCCSFGFTAYGFMAALCTVLEHKVKTFSWGALGILICITFCGIFAFIYQSARFAVSRARFLRLCGAPRLVDEVVEWVWKIFEGCGILHILRSFGDKIRGTISGQFKVCSSSFPCRTDSNNVQLFV